MVADVEDPADVLDAEARGLHDAHEGAIEGPAHDLLAVPIGEAALGEALPQLAAEGEPPAREAELVTAEVAPVHLGVDPDEVVVAGLGVVREREARLGRTGGEAGEGGRLLRGGEGAVRVLDGPVVVEPGAGHGVRAVRPPAQPEVDGVVVHDRGGDAVGARELRIVELLTRVERRGAEVVHEAEGVTGLVHDHLLEHRLDDCLRLRGVERGVLAGAEQLEREAQLLGGRLAVGAPAFGLGPDRGDTILEQAAAHAAHPAVGDADVGVQDLARARVGHDSAAGRGALAGLHEPPHPRVGELEVVGVDARGASRTAMASWRPMRSKAAFQARIASRTVAR